MRSRRLRRAAWATPVVALVAVVLMLFALAGQIMVVCFSTGTVVVRMGDDDGPDVALAVRLQQLARRVAG